MSVIFINEKSCVSECRVYDFVYGSRAQKLTASNSKIPREFNNAPTFKRKPKQKQISPLKSGRNKQAEQALYNTHTETACIACDNNSMNWNWIWRITEFRVCPYKISCQTNPIHLPMSKYRHDTH